MVLSRWAITKEVLDEAYRFLQDIAAKIDSFKGMIDNVKKAYPNAQVFATTLRQVVSANLQERDVLKNLSPENVTAAELAGEPIIAKHTRAPGNQAPLGGLKVITENGWFAARPSGTEDIYKIYTESFKGPEHLLQIQDEARAMVASALAAAG